MANSNFGYKNSKFRFMKTITSYLFILFCYLTIACENTKVTSFNAKDEPISIDLAKKWFIGKFNSPTSRVATENNPKLLEWEKAIYYDFAFGRSVIVPIKYQNNLTPFYSLKDHIKNDPVVKSEFDLSNSQLDNLIIHKDANGNYVERIFKVIPDKDYLIKSNGRTNKAIPFEGLTVITDWKGEPISGFKYINGKPVAKLVGTKQLRIATTSETCETVSYWSCASGDGGSTWYCSEVERETFCYNPNPNNYNPNPNDYDDSGLPSGGGGLGGTTGNGISSTPMQSFDLVPDFKNNLCAKSVFDKLMAQEGGISSFINSFSKGRFARFVYTIKITNNLSTIQDGTTTREGSTFITELNCELFQNFTQLAMARTILHEALHAYMQAYLRQYGKEIFQKDFPNVAFAYGTVTSDTHEEIAQNYLTEIADALKKFDNGRQSDEYYKKLAWAGLKGTNSFKQKSKEDKDEIDILIANEQYYSVDSKGEKCPDNSVGSCQ